MRMLVKQKMRKVRAELIILQETKMDENRNKVLITWAETMEMDIEIVPAIGSARGLATLWKRVEFLLWLGTSMALMMIIRE